MMFEIKFKKYSCFQFL